MTDSRGNSVKLGMFVWSDVGNVRLYGILRWSWELCSYCIHSVYADTDYPIDAGSEFYSVPADRIDEVPQLELSYYVNKYLKNDK